MEIFEQTKYAEGATENCKDLITKANRILSEMSHDKILKMRRGIEQDFVDVVVDGKRLSEDWEDTKTIFSETFYAMLNKYLFDKEEQGVFKKQEEFVKKTMNQEKARLNQIIYFLVNNFLLRKNGSVPKSEPPRLNPQVKQKIENIGNLENQDKIIKVAVDEDGDSIVTYESGTKVVIAKNLAKSINVPQPFVPLEKTENLEVLTKTSLVDRNAFAKNTSGDEALVSTHEEDENNQKSNYQNQISMIKRTQEQVTPSVYPADAGKKLLTIGEKFIGVGFNPSGNENVDLVKSSFSDMADYLLDMEQTEEFRNDSVLKDLHQHAKNAILTASMSMVRVITYKK